MSGLIAVGLEVIASCTVWCPMSVPFPRFERDTLGSDLKTVALLLLAASLQPGSAAVGDEITVSGTPARAVVLEALETATRPVPLGVVGADGTLTAEVPDVPAGRYRVVVAGEREAPVLEVVALSRDTSLLLLGFGFLFVLGSRRRRRRPPALARRDLLADSTSSVGRRHVLGVAVLLFRIRDRRSLLLSFRSSSRGCSVS